MQFVVKELGDERKTIKSLQGTLCTRVFECVQLHDSQVYAAEIPQVSEALEWPLAEDRNEAARCSVVNNASDLLHCADGSAAKVARLELNHAAIDEGRVQ